MHFCGDGGLLLGACFSLSLFFFITTQANHTPCLLYFVFVPFINGKHGTIYAMQNALAIMISYAAK